MFGHPIHTFSEEEVSKEPEFDLPGDADAEVDEPDDEDVMSFEKFSSGLPFLVERPSNYLRRLYGAAQNMVLPPDDDENGGLDGRILYSPAVSLPFFTLYGDEMLASEDVLKYPLFHFPQNHMPTEADDPADYALTLIALYTALGLMREDKNGDLITYGLSDPFDVDDEMWEAAEDWAKTCRPLLAEVNTARLLLFAFNDPDDEAEPLSLLFDLWGEKRSAEEIMAAGKQAAEWLADEYGVFLDDEFKPFEER